MTEFLPDVPWAGKYNTISCAAGHHIYHGRWLRDREYLDDYSRFWFKGGGKPRRYSFWAADAIYTCEKATGNFKLAIELLPDLVKNYFAWEKSDQLPTGFCGLRPRADETLDINPLVPAGKWDWFCVENVPYHNRLITILYDKTREKYHEGPGPRVFIDGKLAATSEKFVRLTANLVTTSPATPGNSQTHPD